MAPVRHRGHQVFGRKVVCFEVARRWRDPVPQFSVLLPGERLKPSETGRSRGSETQLTRSHAGSRRSGCTQQSIAGQLHNTLTATKYGVHGISSACSGGREAGPA